MAEANQPNTDSGKPLAGVRVVDFTRYLAGPMATALLADLGADVMKIESPHGDHYRGIGPRPAGGSDSALFLAANRGKRSIALDLNDDAGRAIARRLIQIADVVFENFRPGVMTSLGLDWEAARRLNSRLVYVSVSGFGQTGPAAQRPAYDPIIQAMSGFMATNGEADQPPLLAGEAIADVSSAVFASWGCLAALYRRERTGMGGYVDSSLLDSLMSLIPTASASHLVAGQALARSGNKHPVSAPFGIYRAGHGYFAIAAISTRQFHTLLKAIGRVDLYDDARFADDTARRANEAELAEIIESWAAELIAKQAVERLQAGGVPASEVLSVAQAWDSGIVRERALATPIRHPEIGDLLIPEQPVHFSESPRGGRKPAPRLNEHEAEILREIGWPTSS